MMKTKQSSAFSISVLLLALAASGCATLPTDAPSLDKQPQLLSRADTEADYTVNGNWWESYHSDTLNDLMQQAFANNTDLKQAALNVNKALYQANILGAELVPTVNGSLGASASKNLKEGGSIGRNFSSQMGLSYELDLWQRLKAGADAQVWEYRAGAEDMAATRLTLANNVTDAYFNIAYLNEAIALNQAALRRYQEIARIAAAKYRHGKVSAHDITQSEQALLAARNNVAALEQSRHNVLQTLRNLLNLRPGEDMAVLPERFALPKSSGADLNVPFTVLANRPDLRAAEYRVQAALQSLAVQQRSWYPSISIGASLGSASDKVGKMFSVPVLGSSVQVNLPFLNWPVMKWRDKTAEANYESAKLGFEQALTTALNEVHGHYLNYGHAQSTLDNLQRRHVLAEKNTRYYRVRYEHGRNELADWLEALNSENTSQQNVLNQRYEVLRYESMIYKAMGGRYTPK